MKRLKYKILVGALMLLLLSSNCFALVTIEEATITTSIVDKNPVGSIVSISLNNESIRLYAYTNTTSTVFPTQIVHIWSFNGDIVAEVALDINAESWRTYSSKIISKGSVGNWSVYIFDTTTSTYKNNLLKKIDFKVD